MCDEGVGRDAALGRRLDPALPFLDERAVDQGPHFGIGDPERFDISARKVPKGAETHPCVR